ncbi:hypothetical protein ACHAXR_009780 [Thalassiosira sp. AJA248-18]
MAEDAAKASAIPAEMEKRDDSETCLSDSEIRTEGNSGVEEEMMMDLNATRFDDDDDEDSKLDLNSVLSGNTEEYEEDNHLEGVFGKNLGAIFDDAKEMDRILNSNNGHPPPVAATAASAALATKPASSAPSRPPLAPGRAVPGSVSLKSNNGGISSNSRYGGAANTNDAVGDKRLTVFLRVRPPVCANGKTGNEGSINTIEVIRDRTADIEPLPTTIRTYPPLNSNAAKVVRGGSKLSASNSSLKRAPSSKSLNDDGSRDSGIDPHAEVRGVKEYAYSGVFGPNFTQQDVYDNVAAPLVEGLFPQSDNDDALGESALLFTLGVTNAGKTHTVMGTGFETKGDKKKMQKNDCTPHKDWGIIPRSLDHMLSRISNLNEKASSGPQLQMYMSYLEIYNEQIFDLLPNKSDAPRRPCDGKPTLKLRESRRGRIFCRGLARHAVNDVQQGLALAQVAKNNRHTASNNINANSSRSHSICQLEIAHSPGHGAKRTGLPDMDVDSEYETDDDSSVCSKSSSGSRRNKQRKSTIIWIVDLAGSERSKRTRTNTRHQKEAALINASLMNLMRCLREMLNHQPKKLGSASKGRGGVVPFRDSKLSYMFMNHLTGPAASRTSMVVNVNPAADDYDETQHVLGYAAAARSVTISAVDYNRKRRMFAKESKLKTSPKKALAKVVKKLSPKKRKGTTESNPAAKRLRSNSNTALNNSKKFARAGAVARKPPPKASNVNKRAQTGSKELEQLREENFSLKVTVDDLNQQLVDCEATTRSEVVDMMDEQLQESKTWYENRITQLKQQITSLQSSKQAQLGVQNNEAELMERIDECEEEMKRQRDEHNAEVEDLSATHLHLVKEHEAEVESLKNVHNSELRAVENEVGTLRHQKKELQVSHDSLLERYNALLASQKEASHHEKENPSAVASSESPSFRRHPRERVSDVATSGGVDITSPKKKRGRWFVKSPAKVATGGGKNMSPAKSSSTRSPLGKINGK